MNATAEEVAMIGSSMPLGAAASQLLTAGVLNLIGCKWYMIIMGIPLIAGWVIIAFSTNMYMVLVGRVLTGFCAATYCVSAPTFTGELADKDIRGALGVMFQLLLVVGILWTYALGEFDTMIMITLPHCVIQVIMMVVLVFLPESPVYWYRKGKIEKARSSLQTYRGKDFNLDEDMKAIEDLTKPTDEKFWMLFKKKANMKGFLMLLGLHVIQQLSGINAVIFYLHIILEMSGNFISSGLGAIIVGLVQVVFTLISAYLVDRSGRKLLWALSLIIMCACLVLLGFFFFIKEFNEGLASSIAFIPLLSVAFYIAGFSLGTGPLPWAMLGEMLPDKIKGPLASLTAFVNWILAFIVSSSFPILSDILPIYSLYWFFAAVCGVGIPYVLFILVETKGKHLDQIQAELSG